MIFCERKYAIPPRALGIIIVNEVHENKNEGTDLMQAVLGFAAYF